NKRRHLFLLLALAALGLVALFTFHSREPEFEGKDLGEWVDMLPDPFGLETNSVAQRAVQQIGTNAIPFLLDELRTEPLPWEGFSPLLSRMHLNANLPTASERRIKAISGFQALGPLADPAIPEIQKILFAPNADSREMAIYALHAIGSDRTLSALTLCLTNSDAVLRRDAIDFLGLAGSRAVLAVPALLTNLESNDALTRNCTARALSRIKPRPEVIVPALTELVNDSDTRVVTTVLAALAALGTDAESAVSNVEKLVDRAAPPLRQKAAFTLVRIKCQMYEGGINRGPKDEKKLALVFTAHEFAEGAEAILNALAKHQSRASFFLTGDFLTDTNHTPVVQHLIQENHFIGPHSDKHLLYCSWEADRKTLVTHDQFASDIEANNLKIYQSYPISEAPASSPAEQYLRERYGSSHAAPASSIYFLPAFEHYNREIVGWAKRMRMTLINFTPGTRSNADYTGEADTNFVSSQAIFDSIVKKEREDPHGLNGFILLLHLGSGPGRADKFHTRFGELLDTLAGKGYQFVRVDELLEPKPETNAPNQTPSP
ncbi:MAG: hypothetical protein EPO07_08475, partial [Verrucomicrobia bacterium]